MLFLPETALSCPAGHSCMPALAQAALHILRHWSITLKQSSVLHSHCCSLLCWFREDLLSLFCIVL